MISELQNMQWSELQLNWKLLEDTHTLGIIIDNLNWIYTFLQWCQLLKSSQLPEGQIFLFKLLLPQKLSNNEKERFSYSLEQPI